MRTIAVFFLAGILAACPLLCRAAEEGCCIDQGQEDGRGLPDVPASCPDDGVTCISAGAIPADQVAPPALDSTDQPAHDAWSALPLHLSAHAPTHAAHGRQGPAMSGDAGMLRALLQNFRC